MAATNADGTSPPSTPSAPVTPAPPAATTLTLAASPTSVLYGGTVTLTGRLQQADSAGIAGETVTVEQRPKGGTSWTALTTVTTTGDGTLDPSQAVAPRPTPSTGCATQPRRSMPPPLVRRQRCGSACA